MSTASQTAQGAAGGAMTGASVGTMILPGWGTAIGGVAGGLIGGIGGYLGSQGGSAYEEQLKALAAKYGGRNAPQAGPAAGGSLSHFRGNQAALIAQLEAMGRGEGPSAAALQMREAMDRAAGAQASALAGAGGRGVNAGAAFRTASDNTTAFNAQAARDTATLRAQEQLSALSQLGGVIGQARGMDEAMSQFNAGQTNDMARANLMAKLQSLGITTEAELAALMAAVKAAGPGFGTQLMAGGAQSMPMALNRLQQPAPGQAQGSPTEPYQLGPSGTTIGPYQQAFNYDHGDLGNS